MENRDFKGIWIPKEIWLCDELSIFEKALLAEIDSLDNENHCTASNDYFANFCKVSVPTITRAIAHLAELNFIEVEQVEGKYRVIKMIRHPNQNDYTPSSKRLAINIDNNQDSNITPINRCNNNSGDDTSEFESHCYSPKELRDDFLGSVKKTPKPKRKSLYDKCVDEVYAYTQNLALQDILIKYLPIRLAITEKPLYGVNQWKGLLNRLTNTPGDKIKVVEQSIEKGWCSFYELRPQQKSVFSEGDGVYCEEATDTAEERADRLREQGRRSSF